MHVLTHMGSTRTLKEDKDMPKGRKHLDTNVQSWIDGRILATIKLHWERQGRTMETHAELIREIITDYAEMLVLQGGAMPIEKYEDARKILIFRQGGQEEESWVGRGKTMRNYMHVAGQQSAQEVLQEQEEERRRQEEITLNRVEGAHNTTMHNTVLAAAQMFTVQQRGLKEVRDREEAERQKRIAERGEEEVDMNHPDNREDAKLPGLEPTNLSPEMQQKMDELRKKLEEKQNVQNKE